MYSDEGVKRAILRVQALSGPLADTAIDIQPQLLLIPNRGDVSPFADVGLVLFALEDVGIRGCMDYACPERTILADGHGKLSAHVDNCLRRVLRKFRVSLQT